jgi:hypothetical protein
VVKKWNPQIAPGAMPIVPQVEPGTSFPVSASYFMTFCVYPSETHRYRPSCVRRTQYGPGMFGHVSRYFPFRSNTSIRELTRSSAYRRFLFESMAIP